MKSFYIDRLSIWYTKHPMGYFVLRCRCDIFLTPPCILNYLRQIFIEAVGAHSQSQI